MKLKLIVMAAVLALAAVAAVGAGALNREPVAPELSPQESGVKPDVVPGEVQKLETPDGTTFYGGVSPCIKSDPTGYTAAELYEEEWCFHPPGEGPDPAGERKQLGDPSHPPGMMYRLRNGRIVQVGPAPPSD